MFLYLIAFFFFFFVLPIICSITFWASIPSYNTTQLKIPHLNCSPRKGLSPAARPMDGCGYLIWPILALLLEVSKQPFPVHPLLVTIDLIHLSHIPLVSFPSQPGESLLVQKPLHTFDYPCCPPWYFFCVSCMLSELRGPDANTHLGCRHGMLLACCFLFWSLRFS